eukprot:TRINITY_DN15667_c0_g1_i1.p2 TRINITY_DN15667_c0_g1~~TRINITY_DN15667_c0_g1_i1.p2  ORF type:complete len:378 (+),score=69.68 TRINITY_DN15667_c0_g1_i1:93-1136(+)
MTAAACCCSRDAAWIGRLLDENERTRREKAALEAAVRALRARLDEAGEYIEDLRDEVWELSEELKGSGSDSPPPEPPSGDSRFCENRWPPRDAEAKSEVPPSPRKLERMRRAGTAGPLTIPLPPELPALLELPALPELPAPSVRRPRLPFARAPVPPELRWIVEDRTESPRSVSPAAALLVPESSGFAGTSAPAGRGGSTARGSHAAGPAPASGLPSLPPLLGHTAEGGVPAAPSPGPLWGSPAAREATTGGGSAWADGDGQRELRRERLVAALRDIVARHFGPAARSAEGAGGGPAAQALASFSAAACVSDCSAQRESSASPPAPRWGSAARQAQAAGGALRRGWR